MVDWDEIMVRDGPAVWRCACRLLGHRADAEDCFQETFVAAVELSRRQEVRHWRAMLLRLATTRAVDRLRQRYRRRGPADRVDGHELAEAVVDRHTPGPPQDAEAAELAAALRRALAELPGRQSQAFCLHHLEGWSYENVGRHLGLSVDGVGVLLYRARAGLRERLGYITRVGKGR
jgi:RNA polymerase sigma-70 factor (ECF subfamily)